MRRGRSVPRGGGRSVDTARDAARTGFGGVRVGIGVVRSRNVVSVETLALVEVAGQAIEARGSVYTEKRGRGRGNRPSSRGAVTSVRTGGSVGVAARATLVLCE